MRELQRGRGNEASGQLGKASSGSIVIPRRARPDLAGLRSYRRGGGGEDRSFCFQLLTPAPERPVPLPSFGVMRSWTNLPDACESSVFAAGTQRCLARFSLMPKDNTASSFPGFSANPSTYRVKTGESELRIAEKTGKAALGIKPGEAEVGTA